MTEKEFKEKYTRRFCIVSNYVSSTYILDEDNIPIYIANILNKGKDDENIAISFGSSIENIISDFYKIPSVFTYGIISAYIWDGSVRKVIKNITDLPDNDIKILKRNHKKLEYNKQITELLQKVRDL